MQLDFPTNGQGIRYVYCVCAGRVTKRKNCIRRAVPVVVAFDERLAAHFADAIDITSLKRHRIASAQDFTTSTVVSPESVRVAKATGVTSPPQRKL